MKFNLQPFDPLFFRDGKPFTMGDEAVAGSVFPPLPSTIYGALRSAYISHNGGLERFTGGGMREQIGTPDEPGAFAVKGFFLHRTGESLFPAPLDMCREKIPEDLGDGEKLHMLTPVQRDQIPCTLPAGMETELMLYPPPGLQVKDCAGYFISQASMDEYLKGEQATTLGYPLASLVTREPKLGIRRDGETHASEEGSLYRITMHRLGTRNRDGSISELSILVECQEMDGFPEKFFIRLGGDGKTCIAQRLSVTSAARNNEGLGDKVKTAIEKSGRLKIYLATPAIFENGWLPRCAERRGAEIALVMDGLELKLLHAAVGKPLSVGGWDIHRNRPKYMRRAVPAGSVYFFEIVKGEATDAIRLLDHANLSDFHPEQGFGLTFVGAFSC